MPSTPSGKPARRALITAHAKTQLPFEWVFARKAKEGPVIDPGQ